MRRVLVTPRSFGKSDPLAFSILENAGFGIVRNETGGILSEKKLAEMLYGCVGVVLGVDPLTKSVIERCPNLKAIAKYGVGIDNIDMEACSERGILVSRTVGANADAVADYTFALILAVARKILPIDAMCRKNDWSKTTTIDVAYRTLGLLGLGVIGRAVAKRAIGFGMKILAFDPMWDDDYAAQSGIVKSDLEDIYKSADFISLHVPLTSETRGMISAKQIELMKPTAVIVNTARGGIVDENALLSALQRKRIYGAGIDAFEEAPPNDPAWFCLDNVVIGSHCAASTAGATEQMGRMSAQNLIRDLERE